LKKIGRTIVESYQSSEKAEYLKNRNENTDNRNVDAVMNLVDAESERRIIAGLSIIEDKWEINGCIKLITQFVKYNQKHRSGSFIEKQIKEAERNNDQELLLKLLNEKQNMAVLKEKQKMALLEKD
jgi:hypothetical protein